MKLSIESWALTEKFGVLEGLQLIKNAGFDCVDMSYYWLNDCSLLLGDGYREYSINIREHLDTLGLICNQAHAPFDVKYGEEFNISDPNYLAVVRAIESAAILGAKTIVVHSIRDKESESLAFDREYNLNYYKSLQPFSEKFKIKIAIENLFDFDNKRKCYRGRPGTPKELCSFIRELNSSEFVACIDTGHAALAGIEPEDYILETDSNLVKAVHIQDGDYLGDRHMLPYLGNFNWEKIMKALNQIGYDGELTFEIVKYLQKIPNDLIPDALSLAEKIGRHLISIFENE